jgi:hypothetical protein
VQRLPYWRNAVCRVYETRSWYTLCSATHRRTVCRRRGPPGLWLDVQDALEHLHACWCSFQTKTGLMNCISLEALLLCMHGHLGSGRSAIKVRQQRYLHTQNASGDDTRQNARCIPRMSRCAPRTDLIRRCDQIGTKCSQDFRCAAAANHNRMLLSPSPAYRGVNPAG